MSLRLTEGKDLTSRIHEFLHLIDTTRLQMSRRLNAKPKTDLGQFFTPMSVAVHMASMFEYHESSVSLLEPCAGIGSLIAACIADICQRPKYPQIVHITAYEIDGALIPYLRHTLALCKDLCESVGISCTWEVREADFIESIVDQITEGLFSARELPYINSIILNPPYRKIQVGSRQWKLLQLAGIKTSNIYTGFLSLCTRLLAIDGEMVAITPRSFCNGLYFKPFREFFLHTMALRRLHLFASREYQFQEDDVLQETLITSATKSTTLPSEIMITTATHSDDSLIESYTLPYNQAVVPGDPEFFIHIVPNEIDQRVAKKITSLPAHLDDLNISVSTGRVVDFRAKEFLRTLIGEDTVALIYPGNVTSGKISWPKPEVRKPHAIVHNGYSQHLLVPNEPYVLVRRFSAKEEKKRVVAALYEPHHILGTHIAFENHLNYFHQNQRGLEPQLAKGLAAFLNSTLIDSYFRLFNGHTQINATDLRNIHYPTRQQLEEIGARLPDGIPTQDVIDTLIEEVLFAVDNDKEINPVRVKKRIEEAIAALKDLGFPRQQQNERSALTLLALLGLKPDQPWHEAINPLRGITQMMNFFTEYYGKQYAPNTRETVRRQTVHQFLKAGLVLANPDNVSRPTTSGQTVYQIEPTVLALLRLYRSTEWDAQLRSYLASVETLQKLYAQERELNRIPVQIEEGKTITLSPGGQNVLVELIIREFAEQFVPGARLLYVGDTEDKFAYLDEERLAALGITLYSHGKIPDIILHDEARNWLILVEAVTSHGPISPLRHEELKTLFSQAKAGLVFVTAFLNQRTFKRELGNIAWATEVWIAESPSHLIHFNGERFLGPH